MNAVLLVISLQKQNILKRFKDVCFSYFPKLLKIGQNSDSVAVYYEQNFKSTMTCIYLCARTIITVVKKLNIIVSMKIFTKYNSNLLIQECIIISKKLCYNHVTFQKKLREIQVLLSQDNFPSFFLGNSYPSIG